MIKKRRIDKKSLPPRYEPGFLEKLDRRTEIFKVLRRSFTQIASDLGGEEELSHIQHALVERFVFLEATLTKIEHDMATNPDGSEQFSRWVQAVNSLTGLAKTLGIQRRVASRPWIEAKGGKEQ